MRSSVCKYAHPHFNVPSTGRALFPRDCARNLSKRDFDNEVSVELCAKC